MYFGLAEVLSLQITKKIGSAYRKSEKCHKYANLTKARKLADLRCAKECGVYMILYPLYCTYYKEGFGFSVLKLSY
jgi:hypothetical protein